MAEDSVPDYYNVLGIEPTASQDAIKDKFQKLSRQFHPDATLGLTAEQKTAALKRQQVVGEAYSAINTPAKRAVYDAERIKSAGVRTPGTELDNFTNSVFASLGRSQSYTQHVSSETRQIVSPVNTPEASVKQRENQMILPPYGDQFIAGVIKLTKVNIAPGEEKIVTVKILKSPEDKREGIGDPVYEFSRKDELRAFSEPIIGLSESIRTSSYFQQLISISQRIAIGRTTIEEGDIKRLNMLARANAGLLAMSETIPSPLLEKEKFGERIKEADRKVRIEENGVPILSVEGQTSTAIKRETDMPSPPINPEGFRNGPLG